MQNHKDRIQGRSDAAVRDIYRPVLRGYFTVFALYYVVMLPFNALYIWQSGGTALVIATVAAAATGIWGNVFTRKPCPPHQVELLLTLMNALVVANVVIALHMTFLPEKLTYFIIMAMLFALASVSFRQSAFSIALAGIALAGFMPKLQEDTFSAYAYLTFGAALASLAIAFFLRKAVTKIADAKIQTDDELKKAREVSEKLHQKSISDSLTALPNRRAFFSELAAAKQHVRRSEEAGEADMKAWLALVDLDGFKGVNDIHGHITGDLLLKEVANRLRAFAEETTHISRMGGDEFNIIFLSNESIEHVEKRSQVLLDSISKPYVIDGRHIAISCSIGCTMLDSAQSNRTQISNADYALMVAKRLGKNRFVLFDDNHAKEAGARFEIEDALRKADLEQEISVVFQPQFELGVNRIVRAEVLARWSNPTIGKISPQRFISIAEDSGLITGITLIVVKKTLDELASWQKQIPISINLSSFDIISDPTIDQIIEHVRSRGLDPSIIEFEVTESAMMIDLEKATRNLQRLSNIGFSIALDDFGTGYSNFNYLRTLPISKLKVDKSFLDNPTDPMTEKVLSSLVGMARVLGVHCVLEGVEDEIGLLMAKRAGASSVQGYLFGKPMPSGEFVDLLETSQADGDPHSGKLASVS